MLPHQQRVVDEKQELDRKLAKLAAFLFTDIGLALPEDERRLLILQKSAMTQYSQVLTSRIKLWEND